MKKLDIYLDTSIWNFLFADDAPEKKERTIQFFETIESGKYNIYISPTVTEEIGRNRDEQKLKMLLEAIDKYQPLVFELTEEVNSLANRYIEEDVVPETKRDDAYHIAYAVCNRMDILLSWNYQHLANINKKHQIAAVNLKEGYFTV